MRVNCRLFLIGFGLLVAGTLPMLAHHSFEAEYDSNKTHQDHGHRHQDGVDESARALLCRREGTRRQGGQLELRAGCDSRAAEAGLAEGVPQGRAIRSPSKATWPRTASNPANARSVVLPDGRRVFGGSSGGNGSANQYREMSHVRKNLTLFVAIAARSRA